jgi:hypothetical protein
LKNIKGTKFCKICRDKKDIEISINKILRQPGTNRVIRKQCVRKIRIKSKNEAIILKENKKIRKKLISIARAVLGKVLSIKKNKYVLISAEEKLINNQKTSERMKLNNPMKRVEVVEKVRQTIKKRIDAGEVVYKLGSARGNWRGNRGFNLDCRSRLYKPWIIHVLKRDCFKCTLCGNNRNLHVHHIRALRIIIDTILLKNNISHIKEVDTKSTLYEKLIQDVILEHKLNDGITVCVSCHDKIDPRYRRYKGENKKNLPK